MPGSDAFLPRSVGIETDAEPLEKQRAPLLARLTSLILRPGESAEERNRKEIWVPFILCAACGSLVLIGTAIQSVGSVLVAAIGVTVTTIVGLFYPITTKRLPLPLAIFVVLSLVFFALICDWGAAAVRTYRVWPFIVLMCDVMLLAKVPPWVHHVVLHATAVALMALGVEDAFRLGIFDIEHWTEFEEPDLFNCTNPPCPLRPQTAIGANAMYVVLLYAHYVITQGFAQGQLRDKERMESAVHVAERVAHLLARYATAEAQHAVDVDGEKLPPELRDAMKLLLRNLTRYRPFLPPSILTTGEDAAGSTQDAGSAHAKQVLPQLGADETVSALEVIVSQVDDEERGLLEELLADSVRSCAEAGDRPSAERLLACGCWDPPSGLVESLPTPPSTRRQTHSSMPIEVRVQQPAPPEEDHTDMGLGTRVVTQDSLPRETSSIPGQVAQGRFGDGADAPSYSVAPVPLWPTGYVAPPAHEAVLSLAQWHTPRGEVHWAKGSVEKLLADFETCHAVSGELAEDGAVLFAYTAELTHPVVWAAWQGDAWTPIADQDRKVARAEGGAFDVDMRDSLASGILNTPCSARSLGTGAGGLSAYGTAEDGVRLVRWENTSGGDFEVSPLRDTVLWTPRPDRVLAPDCPLCIACPAEDTPLTPGILEFIMSRSAETRIACQRWEASPLVLASLSELRTACVAERNQQRPKNKLCQRAEEAFLVPPERLQSCGPDAGQLAAALRHTYKVKCPAVHPTPAQIAHACDLGLFHFRDAWLLLAVTSTPRCVTTVPPEGAPCVDVLWRMDNAHDEQPFSLMNAAMRHQQNRCFDAKLRLAPTYEALYTARQPAHPPPVPAAALFVANPTGDPIIWQKTGWGTTSGSRGVAGGELAVHAWALPQYRALIWRLDHVLRMMSTGTATRKGYRGLQGVVLDRRVYRRGSVVMFGAFTSTSDDQGVATDFASGSQGAAIFTMFSRSGRSIGDCSRYGREMEVLLPPGTLHLVTEALSDEHAAILDKGGLQVFDLKEITLGEAVGHLAKEGALKIRGRPELLELAERAKGRAVSGDWLGAAVELLAQPRASASEQLDCPVLPKPCVGVLVLVLCSQAGSEVGTGVSPEAWGEFFERVGRKARARGGRVLATHVGTVMVHIAAASAEGAAAEAVELAIELVGTEEVCRSPVRRSMLPAENSSLAPQVIMTLPGQRPISPVYTGTIHANFSTPLLAGGSPHATFNVAHPGDYMADGTSRGSSSVVLEDSAGNALPSVRPKSIRRPSRRNVASNRSSPRGFGSEASWRDGQLALRVGVSVGPVHSGFAGSAAQRVEIADGPAVRRARALAAYALRFSVAEVVTDAAGGKAACRQDLTTWTTDLVAFDKGQDLREPAICIAAPGTGISPSKARQIEAAWASVVVASEECTPDALLHMEGCLAEIVQSARGMRAFEALREASKAPAFYCHELGETQ